jgi:hypothetical protein
MCELGLARLIIAILIVLISMPVAVIGILALTNSIRSRFHASRIVNVLNLTLFTLTLGSLTLSAYVITSMFNTLGFATNYKVLFMKSREIRRTSPELDSATFILLVLAQCISANAPLLLPLVWIDLANAVFKFRRRSIRFVKVSSVVFCGVVCFVQFPLYVFMADDFQGKIVQYGEIVGIIWYVVYGFLVILNLIAALTVMWARSAIVSRPKSDANARFVALLNRVFTAAILLSVNYTVAIGLIVATQGRNARTYYNDPTCNVIGGSTFTLSDFCLRLACFCLCFSNAICLWFVFPDTRRLLGRRTLIFA